ncbi:hypothetical protein ACLB2K_069358 [Fragaria x ananassa]
MALHSLNLTLFLSLLSLSTLSLSLTPFSPVDNHLLDCGSTVASTLDDGRRFVPDSSASPLSIPLRNQNPNPNPNSPQIYQTARIFRRPSKYEFQIRDPGTHMVRLHFQSFNSCNLDWSTARFHVLVNGFVALKVNNSGVSGVMIKEYLIWDLVADTAMYVSDGKASGFDGLARQAIQVVHRVNVGGSKVTPFNDSLWRTWSTDEGFFHSGLGSERVYFGGRIKYQAGGASREVGPDNVYNTARLIRSRNNSVANVNMTWVFPAVGGYKYLVRLHFCDIASSSLGLLYFNVYVNGKLAYEDLDLSKAANYMLASPFYADFVVDGDDSDSLSVSVGPSKASMPYAVDGILNGVEIMKLNNSVGSLDGEHCVLVPLVAAACVLLSLSMVTRRRIMKKKESVAWTKLPVDVSEVNAN